jgi:hypothetical protein
MKAFLVTSLLALFLLTFSSTSYSQFEIGQKTGSLAIGVGGGGLTGTGAIPISAEFNFLSFEKNINAGIFAAFSKTSYDFGFGSVDYTYIVIAAQGNWHFMPGDKVDPFAGVSLGFRIASSSISYAGPHLFDYSATGSDVFFNFQAGLNYWFNPEWAIQGRVGYFPYFSVGVTHSFQ